MTEDRQPLPGPRQRIDKWLFFTRMAKSRSLAQAHIQAGHVRINGERTSQNGPRREFMSSGLAPGRTYTFAVTVQWTGSSGETFELERRVSVQGGERRNVDFLMAPPSPPPAIAASEATR